MLKGLLALMLSSSANRCSSLILQLYGNP